MIELDKDTESRMLLAIKETFAEELEREVGELTARRLLDLFLQHIAPEVYNRAVVDAREFLQIRLEDMEATLFRQA